METRIVEQIISYLNEEKYRQAILIDGEWGSGKTFFVKEVLMPQISKNITDKKVHYVSLYGVSTSEEIIKKIYFSYVEEIIDRKIGKEKRRLLKKGVSIGENIVSMALKKSQINPDDLLELLDYSNIKKAIFIFDDLERCGLSIIQTLGILNDLIENNGVKIIIIANQKEIGKVSDSSNLPHKYMVALDERIESEDEKIKLDDKKVSKEILSKRIQTLFSEDALYMRTKEKLIGLTIYYHPKFENVYVSVVEKYYPKSGDEGKEKVRKYLMANKQKLVNYFEEAKYGNIRTLIFIFAAFEKIYKILEPLEEGIYKEYIAKQIDDIFKYIIILSIRIKSGKSLFQWESGEGYGLVLFDGAKSYSDQIYGYRFVDDYLLNCSFDEKAIKEIVQKKAAERKQVDDSIAVGKALSIKKLSNWKELEDDEIRKTINAIEEELKDQKYEPGFFQQIILTFFELQDYEIMRNPEETYSRIISAMEEKLKKDDGKFKKSYLEINSNDTALIERYNALIEPLLKIFEKKENEEVKDFSFMHEDWNDVFPENCKKNSKDFLKNGKFFCYFELEKFINKLKEVPVKEIYNLIEGIKEVYGIADIDKYMQSDIKYINEILGQINVEEIAGEKITKRLALKELKQELQYCISLVKEHYARFNI